MKRDYSLDFLRIVACILVIVIHVANVYCRAYTNIDSVNYIGAIIFNTIARVSVPIFFMISGALLIKPSEFNIKKYLQRIWRLLFALIAWNFIYFLFNKYYLENDLNFYDSFIESFVEPTKRHLWFMYAIIGIYIILPFVQNMCKNLSKQEENLFMGLWLFFVGVVYIIKLELKLEINYLIPIIQGTYYLGYFVVGSILYRRISEKKLDNKWHKFLILLSIMCYVITIVGSCYLSFKHDKYYNLAQKYLPKGTSGVMSITLNGTRQEAMEFMNKLKLASNEVHVADIRTCVLHPASATHRQLTDEQLIACGINPSMIRVSAGLENINDIIQDFKNALD